MALKPCRECGKEVSADADTCPNCGVDQPTKSGLMATLTKSRSGGRGGCGGGCGSLIALVILVGIIGSMFRGESSDSSSPSGSSRADIRYVHQGTNVRAGRSTETEVITSLSPGDSVRIGTQSNGWYEVYPGDAAQKLAANRLGYVYGQLLASTPPSSRGGQRTGFNPTSKAVDAWVMCQDFMEDRLQAPSSADYPCCYSDFVTYEGDRVYEVRSYVDAENAFGAKLRRDFLCRVEYRGNDRWRLRDLQINE